jgi:hypothetical protein
MKLPPNRYGRPVSIALAVAVGFAVAYLASADAGLNPQSGQCGPGAAEPAKLAEAAPVPPKARANRYGYRSGD